MKVGVVTFPGSLDDQQARRAVRLAGAEPVSLWHAHDDVQGVRAVILPGGFSYGDHLRPGAIARHSPATAEIVRLAGRGLPVLGIGNGFQVLCEARLLPGALLSNPSGTFLCAEQAVRVETRDTVWTHEFHTGEHLTLVVKSAHGCYVADGNTLLRLEGEDQVVLRYLGNPNGSARDIAGVTNSLGTVVGLMAHPEHHVDPVTSTSLDGSRFFSSLTAFLSGSLAD